MQPADSADRPGLDLLIAVIARSQIVLGGRRGRMANLPDGFQPVDVAVLDWIADQGRRIGRSFTQM